MRRIALVLTLSAIAPAVSPATLPGQGWVVPRCGVVPPPRPGVRRPVVTCGPADVVRTGSTVRAELEGRVVSYTIEERFENRGSTLGEADYYFPLPPSAAFQDLQLSIDGEMVGGETMNADEARAVYERIVRQSRDPALVEWMGHGLLRLRIFPFRAGEERRVVVRLQSVATREGDALRIDYARGSRLAGTDARVVRTLPVGDVRAASTRSAHDRRAPVRFTLVYPGGGSFGRPYSPTHDLDVIDQGRTRRADITGERGDVTILLPLRRADAASMTMLAHAPPSEDGYALITLAPPARRAASVTPRDFTFVVDVSGSMSGRKLEQAKAAGRQLLATLRPADRFRIVDFSTEARTFREELVAASPANLRAAERYIDRLEAVGGTNISGALEEAMRDAPARGRLGLVLFVTDGAPTAGERRPALIVQRAAELRRGRRLFSFGVGADVNAALVEQLALEGHGTAHFVRPDESVEHTVGVVASHLVDPVLTDVRITARGVRLLGMLPAQPLDLFGGQDLVVLARYAGSGRAQLVVEGTSPSGHVRWTQPVTFPARERDNAFVARLWATQRVGWLSAEKRKGDGSTEHDAEIRRLGERFGIPTEFTSYLVVEPGMVADAAQLGRNAPRRPSGITPAPAPAAASAPAAQFESARAAARMRDTRSLGQSATVSPRDASLRTAVGRTFARDRQGRWTDVHHDAARRVVRIAPYSPAYFALIRELPELQDALALGERVLIVGDSLELEIAPDGAESLGAAALREIVQALKT